MIKRTQTKFHKLFLILGLFISSVSFAQYIHPIELLIAMDQRYKDAPCKSYSFSQKNTLYRNDSVIGTSVWHEAVEFPDKFVIMIGNKEDGNRVLFRNDSSLRYKENKLVATRIDSSTLILLMGGMYYRDVNDAIRRLNEAKYELQILTEQVWENRPTFVIGAKPGDLTSNQVWIDKETFKVMRIIQRMNARDIMDMRFEKHQKMCKGYVETQVSFRRNGKLEQVEEYYDIKETKGFPEGL
ncbi:MAG: hypothetical protein IT236_01355 [Bacteroidia bacterium]|nr:hypothetical protein [Bacteroidia bacterium]